MPLLTGIGLSFSETMSGYLTEGETDPVEGAAKGKKFNHTVVGRFHIEVADLDQFIHDAKHRACLTGTITCGLGKLNGKFDIQNGSFYLFTTGPVSGRQMVYEFAFVDRAGQRYAFRGEKEIYDDAFGLDLPSDMTTLFTTVTCGTATYAAGAIKFDLKDAPKMVASLEVTGDPTPEQRIAAISAFADLAYGTLREQYFGALQLTYFTQYENLVLTGTATSEAGPRRFFLVSGFHDVNFPWGDGQAFSDVLLLVEDGDDWERYCISGRQLAGLALDVKNGTYRYEGPLYRIAQGHTASLRAMAAGSPSLEPCSAQLDIEFAAQPYATVPFPFPKLTKLWEHVPDKVVQYLEEALPNETPMGMYITPHSVRPSRGSIRIIGSAKPQDLTIEAEKSAGEAERSRFTNLKRPHLLYGYICALRPEQQAARVQIHTRTLRDERDDWLADQLDRYAGILLDRICSGEYLLANGKLHVRTFEREEKGDRERRLFVNQGEPLLEVNNDHYPTGVFQRRIIRVMDPDGGECLALEEAMRLMRLESIDSDRTVKVASIHDPDKLKALDAVIAKSEFDTTIDAALAKSGLDKGAFRIAIKPNFMFAYNKDDPSTYTDPGLVEHLAGHLKTRGYRRVQVVEAHSTYGEYYTNRSVEEMAEYLGFAGGGLYEVVDLTETATGNEHIGQHLGSMPVSPAWRDANFRISFAKNKTHTYAAYTLTLKCIYGALTYGNKFKAFHCDRGIYHPTVEYLQRFPVHFGFIDAHLSADGPFGIFADTDPRHTHTCIGGADLVAVDWVGASKMGLDPLVSEYMQLAVQAFGKPTIELVGDGSIYHPWLNVPVTLKRFADKVVDGNYYFGTAFYMSMSQMDTQRFQLKSHSWWLRVCRALTLLLRKAFFKWNGEPPSALAELINRLFRWLAR